MKLFTKDDLYYCHVTSLQHKQRIEYEWELLVSYMTGVNIALRPGDPMPGWYL